MEQSDNHSQLIHPRNTYKRFKKSVIRFLQRLGPSAEDSRDPQAGITDIPVAQQYQGAHDFNVNGNPTTIGVNNGVNSLNVINNYGGAHGLKKIEDLVSFNAQFDSRVQDPACRCHAGTRETVLVKIQDWIDDLDVTEPIIWLCGPTGAGKSAIARTLALSCGRPKVAATFFFCRSDGTRNDGNLLITTLAYQLSISIPAIKDLVAKSLDERPDISRTGIETQFEELIVRPFQALNSAALPVPASIVIIDAVDECIDEQLQRQFLTLICTAARDNRIPLRFILSSRREAWIEDTINNTRCPIVCLDLSDLNADSDIGTYLTDEFSRIASSQGLDQKAWPGSDKIGELVRRASGQFAYASLVMKSVGEEDCSAESQLDMILGQRPPATASPFKHLDKLYLDTLQQHHDQAFLATFLTLFVAYLRLDFPSLHKDNYLLMNITETEYRVKLRRLRSVFRFEPYIDVYHQSFLEFLRDPSRSGQYHIKEDVAARRYLELITESIVRYSSSVINHLHSHDESHHFCPEFGGIVHSNPLKVVLAVEGWQEVLQPLQIVWDNFLDFPNFSPDSNFLSCSKCTSFRIIRFLRFHVMFYEGSFNPIAASSMPDTHKTSRPITFSPRFVRKTKGNKFKKSLNGCLTSLLDHHREPKAKAELSTVDLLLLLLRFDPSETAKNVRSVSDALIVVNLIDMLTTENFFVCPTTTRRAFQLALEIYARIPILPLSLICNISPKLCRADLYADHCKHWECFIFSNISVWGTPFTGTSRILGRNCIIPVMWIYDNVPVTLSLSKRIGGTFGVRLWDSQSQSWPQRLSYILMLAKLFRHFHSEDVVLHHEIDPVSNFQHLNSRAKICFWGVSASYVEETPHLDDNDKERLTFEANVFFFGCLFYCLYFEFYIPFDDRVLYDGDLVLYLPLETDMDKEAWKIIQQCCEKDPRKRPTINEVVQGIEMMEEKPETLETTS